MATKLKKPPNKGAAALPEKVRNNMGFYKRGGKKKTTKKKTKKKGPTPTNPSLYARVKAEAKRKFKVYPSAYANAWLVRTYKKRGGTYA